MRPLADEQGGLLQELERIPGLRVKCAEPMARHTSIKVGGPADYFIEVEQEASLPPTLTVLDRRGVPFFVLGKGSNVLVSDLGVRGAVLRLGGEFKEVRWEESGSEARVSAGAACPVTQLVREAVRRGLAGMEFAEGIPGSVGGALFMNAGAYGSEMEGIVDRVEALSRKGEPIVFQRQAMVFSYRDSHLPAGTIVTRVRLRLKRGSVEEAEAKMRELVGKRKRSQPTGHPNSGSMFRNPPGDFAGRLIDAAGLKGKRIGNAEISLQHGNFIINRGGAKAEEVGRLMAAAREEVRKKFGVELEPEIRFVGEWPGGGIGAGN